MRVDIAWWDLARSEAGFEELAEHLATGATTPWRDVPGLRLKAWVADREHGRWGAIMLWDPDRPADPLPPNAAAGLIGHPPPHRLTFDVEALVEGGRSRPSHDYTVVDAFSRTVLKGNPVAVFFAAQDLSAGRMQRIARETNLSETTFVLPAEHGGDARIRIFTPVNELPFAGHPILGTSIAVREVLGKDSLALETAMGTIPMELADCEDGSVLVHMRQPVPVWEPYEHREELLAALGLHSSTVPVEIYRNGPRHVFVGLPTVEALSALHPDHRALTAFPDMAVNCFAGSGTHWRSRMFSPAYGVVEDAATGSAAGPLAIHLARHGLARYGQEIEILQGVEMGRPSLMLATATGEGDHVDLVTVGGHGVVASRGTLYV